MDSCDSDKFCTSKIPLWYLWFWHCFQFRIPKPANPFKGLFGSAPAPRFSESGRGAGRMPDASRSLLRGAIPDAVQFSGATPAQLHENQEQKLLFIISQCPSEVACVTIRYERSEPASSQGDLTVGSSPLWPMLTEQNLPLLPNAYHLPWEAGWLRSWPLGKRESFRTGPKCYMCFFVGGILFVYF